MNRMAGVVIWREIEPLRVEIALVHRIEDDAWTFPATLVENGESPIQSAFRSSNFDLNISSVFGPSLGSIDTRISKIDARVHYWMAKAVNSNNTVFESIKYDKLEWLSLKEARKLLTSEPELSVLNVFRKTEKHLNNLVLLRHAKAVKRRDWIGDDSDRPLSSEGQLVASKLPKHLEMFGISEIHTSDAFRCMSTVEPIHIKLLLPKVVTESLSEYAYEKDNEIAIAYTKRLAKFGENFAICSHNPILNRIVDSMVEYPEDFDSDESLNPGDAWIVYHRAGRVFQVNYLKAPTA